VFIGFFTKSTGASILDVPETFPMFAPNSAGSYRMRASATVFNVNNSVLSLCRLTERFGRSTVVEGIHSWLSNRGPSLHADNLSHLLIHFGSDKATVHDYHHLYSGLFDDPASVGKVLEIGLGTPNSDVPSNMGRDGKPGASLRAFRSFFKNATIFGADVDERILFTDDRIRTYHVDQNDPQSLERLFASVGDQFDLIIDDGLHTVNANVNVVTAGLSRLRVGGWLVIEDIDLAALSFWKLVSNFLTTHNFACSLVGATGGLLFVIRRVG
jgi:hypothetical protein